MTQPTEEPTALPAWREHGGNLKTETLCEPGDPPEQAIRDFLGRCSADLGKAPADLRILDMGCGRGAFVSWALSQGWNAWGCEISKEYVDAGDGLTRQLGGGEQRLRLIDGPDLPFPEPFDVVISNQVLEHVENLESFVGQVARASKPGTRGLHVLPARWRIIEPHMGMPFVHWLPKGPARRKGIDLMIRAGVGENHFADYPLPERVEIFNSFSEEETFYKSIAELRSAFGSAGMGSEFRSLPLLKIERWAPRLPRALAVPVASAYGRFQATYVVTTQVR